MSDFLMIENGDGGELDISADGDIILNNTLYNAVYLSIFGGKAFYDVFDAEDTETDNDDIEAELKRPVTVPNLNNLASLAVSKLNWMINTGIVKNVDASANARIDKITEIIITITRPDDVTEKYGIIWDREQSELKRFGEIYGRL
ncbi:hypothetical protein DBY21_02890 [Candidatus Gastranaerophilales bacterium]|nr:MAG: hypothetical protein DBY21_02890 [Candidatus Gastranaerophilales bacterium]